MSYCWSVVGMSTSWLASCTCRAHPTSLHVQIRTGQYPMLFVLFPVAALGSNSAWLKLPSKERDSMHRTYRYRSISARTPDPRRADADIAALGVNKKGAANPPCMCVLGLLYILLCLHCSVRFRQEYGPGPGVLNQPDRQVRVSHSR